MAAPTFVGAENTGYTSRTGGVTVAVPAGVTDGDFLILVALLGNGAATFPSTPSGWSLLTAATTSDGGFTVTTNVYWREADSEPSSYFVDFVDESLPCEATLAAYRGAAIVAPAYTTNTGTGATSTILGLTAAADDTLFVYFGHNWTAAGGLSPPSGTTPTWTERFDAGGSLSYLADGELDSGEATGDATQANTNSGGNAWTTALMALEPVLSVREGDLAASESGDDTAELAGGVRVTGSLAAAETGADSAALAGILPATGLLAAIEGGSDSAALAGQILVAGLLGAQETGGDTARILQALPDYSDALLFEVSAQDLTYSVGAQDLRYTVPASDLRYGVGASDLRYTTPAR